MTEAAFPETGSMAAMSGSARQAGERPLRGLRRAVLLTVCLLLTPVNGYAHGIKPEEKQFPAGVPVAAVPLPQPLALNVSAGGWPDMTLHFHQDQRVTFSLHNQDTRAHMFVIGSREGHRDQALLHRLMPQDKYNYPNSRHLAPGETALFGWRFNRAGRFSIVCLLPPHQGKEQATTVIVTPHH